MFDPSMLANQIHRRTFLNSAGVSLGSAVLSALMRREGRAGLPTRCLVDALTSTPTFAGAG